MPIYEFYCPDCHMVFNFFSRSINTTKRPNCPRCDRPKIDRQMSSFSISRGLTEADDNMPEFDESRMERALDSLAGEMDDFNEEDPRQAARLMKKISQAADIEFGPGMQEALRRLEAGEDPEAIEADLGDILEDSEPFVFPGKKGFKRKMGPPAKDANLYDL